ncbi:hypothetical protein GUITHDRAFT_120951 [Guillardia theta CCMP2712]|uniref:Uncharacterized protein n=1 Tax=Guillardia theta (strain CCMP2712) TaxID=905079 RepID=L1I9U2_GUITC|nr:hypothetical protein GUITHDRAFT_120951 [Guillardia theta CCMP2712]EKX32847.1 hypothetical protein GUITHDRAFT_120951 [Guillardia theta CCMP2712]|eukprot:XP_005819827.1 hypothetical protein GUITHDRAFT_120951 [Guillardia theta CCMP2712]
MSQRLPPIPDGQGWNYSLLLSPPPPHDSLPSSPPPLPVPDALTPQPVPVAPPPALAPPPAPAPRPHRAPSVHWTKDEHQRFLLALDQVCPGRRDGSSSETGRPSVGLGRGVAKRIAAIMQTKTESQVRSHAQKYFMKKPDKDLSDSSQSLDDSDSMPQLPPSSHLSAQPSSETTSDTTTWSAGDDPG